MHRSAIIPDLFADQQHKNKPDSLGDPLLDIGKRIDFKALAAKVDAVAPREIPPKGGRACLSDGTHGQDSGTQATL